MILLLLFFLALGTVFGYNLRESFLKKDIREIYAPKKNINLFVKEWGDVKYSMPKNKKRKRK